MNFVCFFVQTIWWKVYCEEGGGISVHHYQWKLDISHCSRLSIRVLSPNSQSRFFFAFCFFLGSTHYWGNLVQYGINRWMQEKRLRQKKVYSFGTMMHCRYGCISSANCTYGTIQALVRSLISLLLLQLFVRKLWVEGFIHKKVDHLCMEYPKEVAKLVLGNWCVSCLYDWKIDSNKSCCQIWMRMTFWVVVWVFFLKPFFVWSFLLCQKKI